MARSGAGVAGRLRRSARAAAVLARLGAGYVRLTHALIRWRVEGTAHLAALDREDRAFVAAFWHGRLFFSPMMVPAGRRGVAMISMNRDGSLIAGIAARFGAGAVRGSSFDRRKKRGKGAAAAYRGALAALGDARTVLGVTPDGPRGPAGRAQPGVARLAAAAGVAVLPVAFAVRPALRLPSWDGFLLPLPIPLARGAKVYGPPLAPPDIDTPEAIEAHRAAIEAALARVTARADALAGRGEP